MFLVACSNLSTDSLHSHLPHRLTTKSYQLKPSLLQKMPRASCRVQLRGAWEILLHALLGKPRAKV
jgi:hypothetical protein